MTFLLQVKNAAQLVTVCDKGEPFKTGIEQGKVSLIENGTVIVGHDGKIVAIGPDKDLQDQFKGNTFVRTIDASGKCVLPGLVDGHTHPVWSGDRVHEFALKLAGVSYMEIHQKGGGIGFTVRHTQQSSEEELAALLTSRLDRMLKLGTTLAEAKTGYGLHYETELKMLKVIHNVNKTHPVDLVGNYLAAHSVPQGSTASMHTQDIVDNQIPKLAQLIKEGVISPTLIDVFCETNVYNIEQTRKILQAGMNIGLECNFHGDELTPIKAGELAGEIGALAMSHCEEVSNEGIQAMAQHPTCAVLLPTTAYLLKLKYPPARKMIEGAVPVALGSDFNPNAHCMSMPMVMNFACVNMKMTLEEALVAATINSAASLGKSKEYGSLEVGKFGDFIVLGAPRWEHLIYQMVDPPIQAIVKKGNVVFETK